MLYNPEHEDRLGRLVDQLRLADAPNSDLFSKIVADACTRLKPQEHSAKAARVRWLIGAGAWTDAALALIELELPQWKLRRLIRDDGAWLCSLSRDCNLPAEFDDMAEASHESMPLAIMSAFVEARRRATPAEGRTASVPAVSQDRVMCCDDFA